MSSRWDSVTFHLTRHLRTGLSYSAPSELSLCNPQLFDSDKVVLAKSQRLTAKG